MPRPILPPAWATNTNYAAGSDPWSGTPTKSQPSGGKIASGFVPNTDEAAEETNWVLNNLCQYASYLDSIFNGANLSINDDFTGDTLDRGIWLAATGNAVLVDESGIDGFGACRISSPANPGTGRIRTVFHPIGATRDFKVTARVRANGGNARTITVGLADDAGNGVFFQSGPGNPNLNWFAFDDLGNAHDTGIAVGATYQLLEILRVSGTYYYRINGVQYFTSVTGSAITFRASCEYDDTGGLGNLFVDSYKLWVDR